MQIRDESIVCKIVGLKTNYNSTILITSFSCKSHDHLDFDSLFDLN